jgi:hypothetical protein
MHLRRAQPCSCYSRIIMLGVLTCCAATVGADVVCSPDPNILWKVRNGGCPHVPWQTAAASDPKVPCVLPVVP